MLRKLPWILLGVVVLASAVWGGMLYAQTQKQNREIETLSKTLVVSQFRVQDLELTKMVDDQLNEMQLRILSSLMEDMRLTQQQYHELRASIKTRGDKIAPDDDRGHSLLMLQIMREGYQMSQPRK